MPFSITSSLKSQLAPNLGLCLLPWTDLVFHIVNVDCLLLICRLSELKVRIQLFWLRLVVTGPVHPQVRILVTDIVTGEIRDPRIR